MSGHSKWSQIKHKKAITDKKKGRIFSKLVREIMIAAKTGGGSDANVRLRSAIERAKAEGVAKDNIERAITKGSGTSEGQDFKEFLYEATGPGGVALLIEGATDSTNRTISELKHLLSKNNGRISEPGSLLWNFQKIGILEVGAHQNATRSKDDIELALIESGARDFFPVEDNWIVETDYTAREHVRKQLEKKGIVVTSASHDYKPHTTLTLDIETRTSVEALLELLTDHDDVQEVYTNIE